MNTKKMKKAVASMMTVLMLSIWFAAPNTAYAKTVTVDGNKIVTGSISGSASRVTASTAYTGGPGTVSVSVTGYACGISNPGLHQEVPSNGGPTSTPGNASATVNAPSGFRFYEARSNHSYSIEGASGSFGDGMTF